MTTAPHVYQAICAVTAVMAKEGIAKTRKNEQQGYQFRGIDDLYCAISAHLAAQKICILPRVIDRSVTERATKTGGVATYTVLTVEFDIVSAVDGSVHMIRTVGEAMDSGDKSTNKAMSAAMKYACLMAFQIPTQGDNDADASTHEPIPRIGNGAPAEKGATLDGLVESYIARIEKATDTQALLVVFAESQKDLRLPAASKGYIKECLGAKRRQIEPVATPVAG